MNAKTKAPAAQDFKDCAHWGKGGSYVVAVAGGKRVRQSLTAGPIVTDAPVVAAARALGTAIEQAVSSAQGLGTAMQQSVSSVDGAAAALAPDADVTTTTAAPGSRTNGSTAEPNDNQLKKEKARG